MTLAGASKDGTGAVALRIAVVGAGAIGGWIAARLALSGQAVSLLARGQTLAVLRADGLTIEDAATGQSQRAQPRLCGSAAEAGEQDVVIVAVKSYSLAEVVLSLAPMLAEHTRVVTAVNGVPWWFCHGLQRPGLSLPTLDADGGLAAALPTARVVGCVVNIAASVPRPGVVRHATGKRLTLGAPLRCNDEVVHAIASALTRAGLDVVLSEFIHQEYWKKLLGNITLNPLGMLTLSDTGQLLAHADMVDLVLKVMREVKCLGEALGIDIGITAEQRLAAARGLGSFRSSMLQDLEGGRPLELDGLFAAVLELARQTTTPVPLTTLLYAIARRRAQATAQYPGALPARANPR